MTTVFDQALEEWLTNWHRHRHHCHTNKPKDIFNSLNKSLAILSLCQLKKTGKFCSAIRFVFNSWSANAVMTVKKKI